MFSITPQTKGLFFYDRIQHRKQKHPCALRCGFLATSKARNRLKSLEKFLLDLDTKLRSMHVSVAPAAGGWVSRREVPGATGQGPHSKLVLEKSVKTWVKYLEISRFFGKRRWFCWFLGFILLSQEKWQQTGTIFFQQTLKNFLDMFHSQLMQ